MLFRLVVKKDGKRGRAVEVRTPTTGIGRAHGNQVRIPSGQVSRKHCRLQMKDGLVTAEDLGSVNGTFLNDGLITGAAVVRPGDQLTIGPVTFVVEYELTPRALKRLDELEFEIADVGAVDDVELLEELDEGDEILDVEAVEEEVTEPGPDPKFARPPTVEEDDVMEVKEAVEDVFAPRSGLEDISWAPPEDGDMRDMLSLLEEGQESMMPKKRPGPRKPSGKGKPKPELEE